MSCGRFKERAWATSCGTSDWIDTRKETNCRARFEINDRMNDALREREDIVRGNLTMNANNGQTSARSWTL